jgi:sugar lactone lactonase YvrE
MNHTAQAALGQENLSYSTLNQASNLSLFYPSDAALDPSVSNTRIFVADTFNSRVLGYECVGASCTLANEAAATRVFGQANFADWASNGGVGSSPNANNLSFPRGVAVDATGRLFVADTSNNRVLVYPTPWSDPTPTIVIGQASMTTITAGSALNKLNAPEGVFFDGTNLWVADTGNNRVLKFTSIATNASAALAVGAGGAASATTLSGPRDVAMDASGRLYVADWGFSRVLIYNTPITNGDSANFFLGQGGAANTGTANKGGVSATSLAFPEKLHVDGSGHLWVADTGNNRVLEYDAPVSNQTAQRVFGQADRSQVPTFTTNGNDAPDGFPNAAGLTGPRGVLVDGAGSLWVCDRNNSRMVGFQSPLAASPANLVADRVIGRSLFVDTSANRASANRMNNPLAIAIDKSVTPNRLWAADIGNNRVIGYNSTANIVTDRSADSVLGQPSFVQGPTNAGINSALQNAVTASGSNASLFFPSGVAVDSTGAVYVADASNSRVLKFSSPMTTDALADQVFGQDNFTARNSHFPYGAAQSLAGSRGVAVDASDNLWVADTLYHRVIRFAPGQPATGGTANLILGQSGFLSSSSFPPYSPGCAANLMNGPQEVYVGPTGRIYVSDSGNNRVLVFAPGPSNGASAAKVFGQGAAGTNFTTCSAGAVSATSLNDPRGVLEDPSGNVYIADYGNNRVLIYYTPFTGGDFSADEVLGQTSLTSNAIASHPGPTTLNAPAHIVRDSSGQIFVSDSENSRILRYTTNTSPFVQLDSFQNPIVIGSSLAITGTGFTAGSVAKLFINGSLGAQSWGPYTPANWDPGFIIVQLPASITPQDGFGSVLVVNTDQSFITSNLEGQYLYGTASLNQPTILTVNGFSRPAPDPTLPLAYVTTNVIQGSTVTITGTGFNSPLVNLFTAAGNFGPITPLGGGTSSQFQIVIPGGAPTGPGSLQVVNNPYSGSVLSGAMSVPIGPLISITNVSEASSTVTVTGTGFSTLTVINLFNKQGASVVNLGGLDSNGNAKIPLTFINENSFSFTAPAGTVAGQAYVQALNPPFIPFTSTGNDPDGAFTITP